jgi:hypothetical protein
MVVSTVLVSTTLLISTASMAASDPQPLPIPGLQLESTTNVESSNHRVLLSPLREVGSEIRADRQVRLAVTGSASLYRLDEDTNLDRARDDYRILLQEKGARIVFQCAGRTCGPSNAWANDIFDTATLYGRDDYQMYTVAAFRDDHGLLQLWVSYSIQRGNRREYLWLERLEVAGAAGIPGIDMRPQRLRGPIIVNWSGSITQSFDWSLKTREQIVAWAGAEEAAVVLTSHTTLRPDEALKAAFSRSRRAGETMQAVLDKMGVPPSKQVMINNGPAFAGGDSPARRGNRIEIVVITEAGPIKDL